MMETQTKNSSSDFWFNRHSGRHIDERMEHEERLRCHNSRDANYLPSRRELNFSTYADFNEKIWNHKQNTVKKTNAVRNSISHRMIEKRRRDRMNNCLADLSHLIPKSYLKQGHGRLEKTEIIELAIRHIQYLQSSENNVKLKGMESTPTSGSATSSMECCIKKFCLGYQECQHDGIRFLAEAEGNECVDPFCLRIISYLKNARHSFQNGKSHESKSCPYTRINHGRERLVSRSGLYETETDIANVTSLESSSDSGWYDNSERTDGNITNTIWSEANHSKAWSVSSYSSSDAVTYSSTDSSHSGNSVPSYKFKNSITERFSRETTSTLSDASSISS